MNQKNPSDINTNREKIENDRKKKTIRRKKKRNLDRKKGRNEEKKIETLNFFPIIFFSANFTLPDRGE